MNLPNKLTLARIVMIPVFLAAFYLTQIPCNYLIAFVIFVVASITDILDGQIARKRGLVTDFGVLMDPLADKILVMAAMICFLSVELIHGAVVVIILAREFMVTSIRLVAAGKGDVIAADIWGKIKTILQMIWICAGLLYLALAGDYMPGWILAALLWLFIILTWAVVAATVFSGVNYTVKNRRLFADA